MLFRSVASVPLATPNQDATVGIIQVIPQGGPDSQQTADLVRELRSMEPHFKAAYGVDLAVTGVTAAQMNLFYGLAVIALDGMTFVDQYREDRLKDPRILDFITRVTARVDPELEGMGAAFRHAARVEIKTRDGRSFKREILNRRGSPENPLKPADVEYKFKHVAKSCLSAANIDKVMQIGRAHV